MGKFENVNDASGTPRRGLLLAIAGIGAIPIAGVGQASTKPPAGAEPVEPDDCLDVRQFGARCDGRTDDADAVQAAVDAALNRQLPPSILISGTCYIGRSIKIVRPVDTTKTVFRIIGTGAGAGFKSNRATPMFVGARRDGAPGTEFLRFEAIRFEGASANVGPVMSGDFLRITFAFCEFIAIGCLTSQIYAQEWRFIGCLARGWRGIFFSAAGGYNVTSSNSKYQFGGAVFKLVDPTLLKSGCVGCSFVQDIFEGSVGPFLQFELGKGVNVSNLHAEDIEQPTIIVGDRAQSVGVSISGCFFGTRPDNVKAADFGEIVWNRVNGGVSIGNVAVGHLHRRDARATNFSSFGDYDGVAP